MVAAQLALYKGYTTAKLGHLPVKLILTWSRNGHRAS